MKKKDLFMFLIYEVKNAVAKYFKCSMLISMCDQ